LGEFSPVIEALLKLVPPVSPGPEVRARIFSRLDTDLAPRHEARYDHAVPSTIADDGHPSQPHAATIRIVAADSAEWRELAPGCHVRVLHRDEQRRRVTALIRAEPGMTFPAHAHDDYEECYILEGDLITGDVTLRAGDYQYIPAHCWQQLSTTATGCLLLVSSPLE
jgi:anti-sigma factor ChrR (cupin superfamily)